MNYINRSIGNLKSKWVDLEEFCHRIVRNSDTTRFWLDKWLGQYTLKDKFPRVYMLDPNKEALISDRNSPDKLLIVFGRQPRSGVTNAQWEELCSMLGLQTFSAGKDYFVWELASDGHFSVASTRCLIDESLLEGSNGSTRWHKLVQRKINIIVWRIEMDRILSRINLRDKGVDLDSLLCSLCSCAGESTYHLFVRCVELKYIYCLIAKWWNVDVPSDMSVGSILKWAELMQVRKEVRLMFDAVVAVTLWLI